VIDAAYPPLHGELRRHAPAAELELWPRARTPARRRVGRIS
jgi:hypothetical protein